MTGERQDDKRGQEDEVGEEEKRGQDVLYDFLDEQT